MNTDGTPPANFFAATAAFPVTTNRSICGRRKGRGRAAAYAQLRRLRDQLEAGDVLTVTRFDRLARSTRDLLNTLAAITGKKAGFKAKSPGEAFVR